MRGLILKTGDKSHVYREVSISQAHRDTSSLFVYVDSWVSIRVDGPILSKIDSLLNE